MAKDAVTDAETPLYVLSRRDVAARLGISTSSVRRMECDRLNPVQDARGIYRFDPAELEGLEARAPRATKPPDPSRAHKLALAKRGRLAAYAFRMFARQMSLAQIVIATRQPPEVIRELYREWSTDLDRGEWERRQAAEQAFEAPLLASVPSTTRRSAP